MPTRTRTPCLPDSLRMLLPTASSGIGAEFEGADLKDRRLTERLVHLASTLVHSPSGSFPAVMGDDASLEATYRFLSNERVTPAAILEPHLRCTATRVRTAAKQVVVAHDTTELNYGRFEREGLGRVGRGKAFGVYAHIALAVLRDERAPLGVLALKTWTRTGEPTVHLKHGKNQLNTKNEARRRGRGRVRCRGRVRAALALAGLPANQPRPGLCPALGVCKARGSASQQVTHSLEPRSASGSAASAQAVQHRRDAIEPRFARLDVSRLDVAPSDGHAERRTRLRVGACRGAKARDAVTTLAAIALGDVERHGAKRSSKLVRKVPVIAPDPGDDGSEDFDSLDR